VVLAELLPLVDQQMLVVSMESQAATPRLALLL
jgi:hypothetical protein